MSHVTIGVAVPARDAAPTLPATLDAIARQSRIADAVVVVDDGSNDDTTAIARAAGCSVIRFPDPRGPGAARNAAIEALETTHVAFLDADDTWPDDYLESVGAMLARSGADVVVAPRDERSDSGASIGHRPLAIEQTTPRAIAVHNWITQSGVTVARRRLLDVGGYDASLPFGQDADLLIRLGRAGARFAIAPTTVTYTVRDRPESRARVDQFAATRRRLATRWANELTADPRDARRIRHAAEADVALRYAKSGHRLPAIRAATRAWSDPRAAAGVVLAIAPGAWGREARNALRSRRVEGR